MKVRIFHEFWNDDNYDVTDKIIEVFYLEGDWKSLNVCIKTNDGILTQVDGKWTKTTTPVNMKQLKERVMEFLNSECSCFDDVWEDWYLVTMRDDMMSEEHISLAEIW